MDQHLEMFVQASEANERATARILCAKRIIRIVREFCEVDRFVGELRREEGRRRVERRRFEQP